ncbi:LuxR C-terminal-related transcriptional regulator [Streptomyces sp. NPDC093094]|uniref:LuxR C-terminal-related transcriptional regulator n=1 Tax=Streptomyces sp. NPDC093094 TaxID=3366026 RepID=UPI0037F43E08
MPDRSAPAACRPYCRSHTGNTVTTPGAPASPTPFTTGPIIAGRPHRRTPAARFAAPAGVPRRPRPSPSSRTDNCATVSARSPVVPCPPPSASGPGEAVSPLPRIRSSRGRTPGRHRRSTAPGSTPPAVHRDLAVLTPREREVPTPMGKGPSNAEPTRELTLGEATAKTHVARILAEPTLRDRAQAVGRGAVRRLRLVQDTVLLRRRAQCRVTGGPLSSSMRRRYVSKAGLGV